MMSIS